MHVLRSHPRLPTQWYLHCLSFHQSRPFCEVYCSRK
jgi:hypothetical protein